MSRPRPPQPETPPSDAFEIHRAEVAPGMRLAYVREGVGGYPLVLVHGYPETKRIWWRNIRPLAEAGYEVIVPDLRGYGDSDLSEQDEYDLVLYSRDVFTLVHDVLGHERFGLIGGDVGGVVNVDLANRFPAHVDRMIFFNTVAPIVPEEAAWYAAQGLSLVPLEHGPTGDYRIRQGRDHEALRRELDTPARCRQWVRDCYEHRLWASPGAFEEADYDFMTEPFADIERLAAAWAPYQLEHGRPMSEMPLVTQKTATPTLILYGPDDHVVPTDFPKRCEIAFPNRTGPLVVPESGHFLQWERADVLNEVARFYFSELRDRAAGRA
ncbi:MAG: alpha/beta hydrolase [Spirochaetaceae bacterium]|nr:alpha/beta hydrolase [Myxococcales bacterium]MCB9724662.1 alpha/beta hydrolase [Spirochaetaceae bacterium]